ncbi:unnamed protein product [Brassica rapa subsp. narinosa]
MKTTKSKSTRSPMTAPNQTGRGRMTDRKPAARRLQHRSEAELHARPLSDPTHAGNTSYKRI